MRHEHCQPCSPGTMPMGYCHGCAGLKASGSFAAPSGSALSEILAELVSESEYYAHDRGGKFLEVWERAHRKVTQNTKLRRGGPDNNNVPGDPPSPGVIG